MKVILKILFVIVVPIFLIPFCVYSHGVKDHKKEELKKEKLESISSENSFVKDDNVKINKPLYRSNKEIVLSLNEFPSYHPLVVHFPIVLILISVLFHLISFFTLKDEMSIVTIILLFIGLIGAIVATRFVHPHTANLNIQAATVLQEHELYAAFTVWLSGLALTIKCLNQFYMKRKLLIEILSFGILLGAALSVSISAHHGAQLVHIEGIGPKGMYLEKKHDH